MDHVNTAMDAAASTRRASTHLGRRRLVSGAAWAAPALLAAHNAPFAAASVICPTNVGFLGLWNASSNQLSILLTNNGSTALPAGGQVYATVLTEYGQQVTLASGGGGLWLDTTQSPTFSTTPTASVPANGSVRWLFTMTAPVPANGLTSLLFSPTSSPDWIVRVTYSLAGCPPTEACFSGIGLTGSSPGTYCSFPGPS